MLDNDILTLLFDGHAKVNARVLEAPWGSLANSVIAVEKQLTGW